MARKLTKILTLTGKTCRMGKISNNLERHGDDYVPAFTIPITELMLTKAELNALMRDPLCWASWYASGGKGKADEPMPWWSGESFDLHESFEADKAMIIVSGDRELSFESTGDPKEDDYRAAMAISGITLLPRTGGMTELNCKVYVLPGMSKTNLALQDHQHREIKLTVVKARVEDREKKQPQLPLGEGGTESPAATAAETKAEGDSAAATATH
jgi:hypothetical protein